MTPVFTTVVTPVSYTPSPDKFLPDLGGMKGEEKEGATLPVETAGRLPLQAVIGNLF